MLTTVIVTYNRRHLLEKCLLAISKQSIKPDHVFLIDNASTDGTPQWLMDWLPKNLPSAELIALTENIGGAGGFSKGLQVAIERGSDWVWMMDDDAEPQYDALEKLIASASSDNSIYGSVAVDIEGNLCWPLVSNSNQYFHTADAVTKNVSVVALPFLGILIPRTVVSAIGYPDAEYFIAGDDTEYCFRARNHGFSIIAIGASRICHPSSKYYRFGIGPWAPMCFYIAPWKRYYDVRNRILTSWQHGVFHVWTRTLPAALLRLLATLIYEPARLKQLRAYIAGIIDGMRKVKGIRHGAWGFKN